MTRSPILLTVLLAVAACQPADDTDAQTARPGSDSSHAGMDHGAMGHDMTGSSSYSDIEFLDQMTMHHQMAVEMARTAVTKASSPEVRRMAQAMVSDQEGEISQMATWRQEWFPGEAAPDTTMSADEMAAMGMGMDMSMLDQATGAAYDRMFLQHMIPHHAGAVTMAAEAQMQSERPEVRELAETIIAAQAKEIGDMQEMIEAMPEGSSMPADSTADGQ
jgi:uncharacterized protein (DUF305 family)